METTRGGDALFCAVIRAISDVFRLARELTRRSRWSRFDVLHRARNAPISTNLARCICAPAAPTTPYLRSRATRARCANSTSAPRPARHAGGRRGSGREFALVRTDLCWAGLPLVPATARRSRSSRSTRAPSLPAPACSSSPTSRTRCPSGCSAPRARRSSPSRCSSRSPRTRGTRRTRTSTRPSSRSSRTGSPSAAASGSRSSGRTAAGSTRG